MPEVLSMAGRAAPAEKEKLEALATMDLVKIMRGYVLAVANAATGYKALVVDKDTIKTASLLLGRTELGEHSVVLVERLETKGKSHGELKVSSMRVGIAGSIKAGDRHLLRMHWHAVRHPSRWLWHMLL